MFGRSGPSGETTLVDIRDSDVTPDDDANAKRKSGYTYRNPMKQESRKYPWKLVRESAKEQDAAKVDHMYNKWEDIEEDLTKSEKLFKRWSKSDDFARGCFRVIIAVCLISSTVVSVVAGAAAWNWLSFVAAGLTAFGALQETLVKMCITDFTTKKRKKYHDQVRIRRLYLDKMFISYLDASDNTSEDGKKISVNELKQYLHLTYEMEEKLMESSMENQDILSHFLQSKLAKNTGTSDTTQTPENGSKPKKQEASETDPLLAYK